MGSAQSLPCGTAVHCDLFAVCQKNISLIDDRSISDEMIRWAAERTGIKPYPESSDYTFDDEVTRRFNDDGVLYVYLQ